jgi:spore coat protein U-like protein
MMMKLNRKLLGAVALFAMFSSFEANAQSSQNINVTAQVQPTCVINGGGTTLDFDFGIIDTALGADVSQSATFTWRCTAGLAVEIELDAGDNAGSDPASARLLEAAPGDFLEYLLCFDAVCGSPWGDGTTAPDLATSGSGMGVPTVTTIYGVLDGTFAQAAVPGSYQETVVLLMNF